MTECRVMLVVRRNCASHPEITDPDIIQKILDRIEA